MRLWLFLVGGQVNGDSHKRTLSPKTFFKLAQPANCWRFSFLRFSIPVESHHIDFTWIKNMIKVNRENKSVSNTRKTSIMRFSGDGLPFLDIIGHDEDSTEAGSVIGGDRLIREFFKSVKLSQC